MFDQLKKRIHYKPLLAAVALTVTPALALATAPTKAAASINEAQLTQYKQAIKLLNYKQFDKAHQQMSQMVDHPLYPYLIKKDLEQRIKRYPHSEVDAFLSQYGQSVAGRQFRHKWLTQLAKAKRWDDFLQDYQNLSGNKKLACWHIDALHYTDKKQLALQKTSTVWLNKGSMPKACDPPFRRWQQAGMKTDDLVWQRFTMALNANNMKLASYLKRRSSEQLAPDTRRLYKLHRKPHLVANNAVYITGSPRDAEIIAYGLKRLAYKDPDQTTKLWQDYQRYNLLSDEQNHAIRQNVGRQLIASADENALPWLLVNDPNATDSYLLEWRIRLAIKNEQWSNTKRWIQLLPEELQEESRWQYWLGRSLQQFESSKAAGDQMLAELANQRHYYGFLAAQTLGVAYQFNHSALELAVSPSVVSNVDGIQRAEAFLLMDQPVQARREWRAASKHFDQQQLLAATALAHQWGWHQQAIMTTLKAKHFDDLEVRFPLAHRDSIFNQANHSDLKAEWIYAITRQESAFAGDAYSSAGAKGLMQVKPSTAKQMARSLGIKYRKHDLFNEEKNITIGSHYLQHLLTKFDGNRILATAAYNAGPYRLNRWLSKQQADVNYDVWIETLPFYETRDYVQNVLAFSVIYGHRLGTTTALIEADEQVIVAPSSAP